MDQSPFKPGSANQPTQNQPTVAPGVDGYGGGFKPNEAGLSEAERFGTDQNPVQTIPLPARGLR